MRKKDSIPDTQVYINGDLVCVRPEHIKWLFAKDLIIDVSEGGVITGPSAEVGDIELIAWRKDAEVYITRTVSVGDFLINAFAATEYESNIKALSYVNGPIVEGHAEQHSTLYGITAFDVTPRLVDGEPITPVLFFGTNFMGHIPAVAAAYKLEQLNTINRVAWEKHVKGSGPGSTINETALLAKYGPGNSNN